MSWKYGVLAMRDLTARMQRSALLQGFERGMYVALCNGLPQCVQDALSPIPTDSVCICPQESLSSSRRMTEIKFGGSTDRGTAEGDHSAFTNSGGTVSYAGSIASRSACVGVDTWTDGGRYSWLRASSRTSMLCMV